MERRRLLQVIDDGKNSWLVLVDRRVIGSVWYSPDDFRGPRWYWSGNNHACESNRSDAVNRMLVERGYQPLDDAEQQDIRD